MGASPHGNLELFFHTHRNKPNGEIEEYGVEFEVDPQTHAVLDKRQGTGLELHRTQEASVLSRFLVDIHTELHLPRPWGLLLTGILGLAMMVAFGGDQEAMIRTIIGHHPFRPGRCQGAAVHAA